MSSRDRQQRKSYGMRRMGKAIGRAMQAPGSEEQARAIRWAAAWGLLCGIRSPGVRLRDAELLGADLDARALGVVLGQQRAGHQLDLVEQHQRHDQHAQ